MEISLEYFGYEDVTVPHTVVLDPGARGQNLLDELNLRPIPSLMRQVAAPYPFWEPIKRDYIIEENLSPILVISGVWWILALRRENMTDRPQLLRFSQEMDGKQLMRACMDQLQVDFRQCTIWRHGTNIRISGGTEIFEFEYGKTELYITSDSPPFEYGNKYTPSPLTQFDDLLSSVSTLKFKLTRVENLTLASRRVEVLRMQSAFMNRALRYIFASLDSVVLSYPAGIRMMLISDFDHTIEKVEELIELLTVTNINDWSGYKKLQHQADESYLHLCEDRPGVVPVREMYKVFWNLRNYDNITALERKALPGDPPPCVDDCFPQSQLYGIGS